MGEKLRVLGINGEMKRVLCILENGFEEIELVTSVDLLRRAEIEVVMAGVTGRELVGKNGIHLLADSLLEETPTGGFDALLLPGGPAAMTLRKMASILALIREFDEAGRWIAAICAAPLLLKDAGVLRERRFTAHFSTSEELPESSGGRVERDGKLLTSRGAGTALDFGLALVAILKGREVSDEISAAVMA